MKRIKIIVVFVLTILLVILGLLQFPKLFISKTTSYGSFELYSNTPIAIQPEVTAILDAVEQNIQQSHFYDPNQVFELYFIKDTFYEKLLKLFGTNHMASSLFDKQLYFGHPHFAENKLVKGSHAVEWVNLVQIISHESVHSQMYPEYSFLGRMKTPVWINEGYCEYISYLPQVHYPTYPLETLLTKYQNTKENWIQTEFKAMTPKTYARDRILMHYLLDIKKMNIIAVIKDSALTPETLLKELELNTH